MLPDHMNEIPREPKPVVERSPVETLHIRNFIQSALMNAWLEQQKRKFQDQTLDEEMVAEEWVQLYAETFARYFEENKNIETCAQIMRGGFRQEDLKDLQAELEGLRAASDQ